MSIVVLFSTTSESALLSGKMGLDCRQCKGKDVPDNRRSPPPCEAASQVKGEHRAFMNFNQITAYPDASCYSAAVVNSSRV
jgi:hypothetical protein